MELKEIGKRIKERRLKLNITQTVIMKEKGISSGNISDIENGKKLPSSQTLISLSEVLECSIDYILTGKEYNDKGIQLSEKEKRLLRYFKTLDEEEQDEIIANTEYKYNRKLKSKETRLYSSNEDINKSKEIIA